MTDQTNTVTEARSVKTAYAYSQTTGEYLGVVMSEPDQLDDDHWLLPAYATFTAPIEVGKEEAVIWQDGAWCAVVDQRGVEYWDEEGTQHTVSELGETLPENALLQAPYIAPTVEEKVAQANTECTARIEAQWDQVGQINASLGVYGEAEKAACAAWIAAHRVALESIVSRNDLLALDFTDDAYWQIVIEEADEQTDNTAEEETVEKEAV